MMAAEPVGQFSQDGQQRHHRKQIGRDDPLDERKRRLELVGHRRQRQVDDAYVQRVHKRAEIDHLQNKPTVRLPPRHSGNSSFKEKKPLFKGQRFREIPGTNFLRALPDGVNPFRGAYCS
jgi:hypothetical protein